MWLGKVKLLCCVLWFHQTVVCSLIIICGFLCHWFFPFLLLLKKTKILCTVFPDFAPISVVFPGELWPFSGSICKSVVWCRPVCACCVPWHYSFHLTYGSGSVPRFKQTCLKYHCHCFCSVNATVILSFGDYFACLYYLLFYNNNNNNLL